jgi:hypothetical protein
MGYKDWRRRRKGRGSWEELDSTRKKERKAIVILTSISLTSLHR